MSQVQEKTTYDQFLEVNYVPSQQCKIASQQPCQAEVQILSQQNQTFQNQDPSLATNVVASQQHSQAVINILSQQNMKFQNQDHSLANNQNSSQNHEIFLSQRPTQAKSVMLSQINSVQGYSQKKNDEQEEKNIQNSDFQQKSQSANSQAIKIAQLIYE